MRDCPLFKSSGESSTSTAKDSEDWFLEAIEQAHGHIRAITRDESIHRVLDECDDIIAAYKAPQYIEALHHEVGNAGIFSEATDDEPPPLEAASSDNEQPREQTLPHCRFLVDGSGGVLSGGTALEAAVAVNDDEQNACAGPAPAPTEAASSEALFAATADAYLDVLHQQARYSDFQGEDYAAPRAAALAAREAVVVKQTQPPRAATAPHFINPKGDSVWQDAHGYWRDDSGKFAAPVAPADLGASQSSDASWEISEMPAKPEAILRE